MSAAAVGVVLAVLASVALNGAFLLQHRGSRSAPAVDVRRPLRTVVGLLRSRVWLAGLGLGLGGWALHVAALSEAPLSLVQAFAGGGLALIVPLGGRLVGVQLDRGDARAVVAMAVALALLAIGLRSPASHTPPAAAMAVYLAAAGAVAALLVRARAGTAGAAALGAGAGVLYGAADAATKAVTAAARGGLPHALASPWLGAVAVATAAAFFAFQRGLQVGAAVPVISLMTAGTSVASLVGAFAVFGDPLGASPALAALHALGFVLAGAAAWRLVGANVRLAEGAAAPPARPIDVPA